jgi:hypothetical protein
MLNMKTTLRLILGIALLFAATIHSAYGANTNARIKGTVTDPTGAVISSASVVATNLETGVKFTTVSQADGGYFFPQLPIGTYGISVSSPGFSSFSAKGIVLNIDQEYVEPVKLSIGSAQTEVQVAADAVQVNTTDMELSNVVDAKQMEQLPLLDRNFYELEQTLPGVALPESRFGSNYSVSGSQSQQSEYLINGADTNDIALNSIVLTPSLDAIGQFTLLDGPLNAEYDRNSGGIVSASIKQGTNQFHGNVFEFYRDTFLNTNNYLEKTFDPTTGANTSVVSAYHQNIFGGTVGGPIVKDKLFFFGSYQGIHNRVPELPASTNVVYNAAQLAGDYSADIDPTLTSLPCTAQVAAATNSNCNLDKNFGSQPIPATVIRPAQCLASDTWAQCAYRTGGIFPTSSFNSLATKLAGQYIPAANNGTNTYQYNPTQNSTDNQYIGRIDYDFNPKNQITVLGLYETFNLTEGAPFDGATVPGFGDEDVEHIQQWTFDYVRQLSSTAVNDLSAHYTRFNYKSVYPQQVVQPSSVGFAITPDNPAFSTLPTITVGGDASFTIGGTADGPQPRIDQTIQFDDTFSKTFGNHNLKFGYDGRRFNVSNTFGAKNSGSYTYNGAGVYSTGLGSLDYLLGIPDSYNQGSTNLIQADAFLNYIFAQDNWKVSKTFTLNYGLGYSIDTPLRNHQYGGEGIACFSIGQTSTVFPTSPTNLTFPGDHGCTNSGQAYTRYSEFGPRIGFAWAPDLGVLSGAPGKLSIRGGFGIYYNRTEEESALETQGTPPFGLTSGGALDAGGSPSFQNPFADINGVAANSAPNPFPFTEPVKGQAVTFNPQIYNIDSVDKSFRSPYAENFQLTIERELPSKTIARVSYVGSVARHNQDGYEGNYTTAAGHAACVADPVCSANGPNQAGKYPSHAIGNSNQLVEIGETGSYSSSSYNSLQVSLTKAATHGFLFQLSYTYSHSLDNGSSYENLGFGGAGGTSGTGRGYNQYDPTLNYGNSAFDLKHHFVFSPVYTSPILHGHGTFSPINLALSGWQVSGIMTLATGEPFDVSYGGFGTSNALYCSINYSFFACPDIPEQVAPYARINPRANINHQYFQTTSFAAEPIGQFGNIGRDAFRQPGTESTNLILAKNFNLSADSIRYIQIRMESDNVFNHTNFQTPGGDYASGTFGLITAAGPSRNTQLGAKIYF